jgi:non-ribosomal peptide synthase protein (TIGR01720 family)
MWVETDTAIHKDILEKAMFELVLHHDALRSRFTLSNNGWTQEIIGTEGAEIPVTWKDLSGVDDGEQRGIIVETTKHINASLDISHGPIVHAAFFKFGDGKPGKLLIAAHHLVMDSVSWRVFFEDLETGLRIASGEDVSFPAKTSSVKQWAEVLIQYAQSKAVTQDIKYWKTMISKSRKLPIPVDHPDAVNNRFGDVITFSQNLDEIATLQLLQETQHAYNTKPDELLLTALAKVLVQWTGENVCRIDIEGHGREEIDQMLNLLRTIGWFTSLYPVTLNLCSQCDEAQMIMTVKEQLRQIPNRGFSYGLIRYLNDSPLDEVQTMGPKSQILFNYLGQFDQMLSNQAKFRLDGSITVSNAPENQRRYAIELIVYIQSGKLYTDWIYNEKIHHHASIQKIASQFLKELQAIISHCIDRTSQTYTPSDFPDVDFDQDELDSILSEFGE